MVIISGVRLAGKVDAVERVGHVATRFFHLYYVPLIPLGTYFVTPQSAASFNGVPLPLCIKSILIAWLRTAGWVGSLAAGVTIFSALGRGNRDRLIFGMATLLASVALLSLLYWLKPITRATYERALELAQRVGLSPEQRLTLEVAYGRMSADQAERELLRQYEVAAEKAVS